MTMIAVMDEYGEEMAYLVGYTRKNLPDFVQTEDDWVRLDFGVYTGQEGVVVCGLWFVDDENCRMRSGKFQWLSMVLNPKERLSIHFRHPDKPTDVAE